MRAYQSTRAEMRANARHVTNPAPLQPRPPARIVRGQGAGLEGDSHIEPWMELAFKGLTHASETGEPFALVSCFMNGQPAAVIAAVHQRGGDTLVMPLFLAVQPGMTFRQHGEQDASASGDVPPEPG